MSTASADARPPKRGKLVVERNSDKVIAAKLRARGVAEVILGSPFGAFVDCPSTGTDRFLSADENTKAAGNPSFNSFIRELAQDHRFDTVVLTPDLVKHTAEHSSLDEITAGVQELTAHGFHIVVDASAFNPPPPAPKPRPLAVEPGDLPNAGEGSSVADGAVGAPLVVVAHPVWQRRPSGLA